MHGYSRATLIGRLVRDIAVRDVGSTKVAEISVAVNRTYSVGGDKRDEVSYYDVCAYGKTADVCAKYLSKGDPVFVAGRMEQRRWKTKDTNESRSKIVIVADIIRFLKQKERNQEDDTGPGSSYDQSSNYEDDPNIPF